ncbi:MAG: TetR/AcrR family transcriptional regulator [Actinomycetales bacterium]|nr:MAG: TetR/AcrR family transcriptional regulator [Actinomycetales bacterium]
MGEQAESWRVEQPMVLDPILAAALAAFYEQGYHGTPVRDIARRVGVTVPALYYHHANKEAILVALLDRITRDFIDRARAADVEAGEDVVQRLRLVVESIALGMTWRPELASLQPEMRYLSDEKHAEQAAVRDELEGLLAQIVAEGVDLGAFRVHDVAGTVRALLGMLHWITTWFQRGGELSPDQIATQYADHACRLVGAAR